MFIFRGEREVDEVVCYSIDVVVNHGQFTGIPGSRAAAFPREVEIPIVMCPLCP
jgi:hypothetical protein